MKKMNASALRAVLTFTAILTLILVTHAQSKTFTIRGQVIDDRDSLPIAGAVVHIPGTKFSDTANADGYFIMSKVPAGTSVFAVVADKYERWSEKIVVKRNTEMVIRMVSASHADLPDAANAEEQEYTEPQGPAVEEGSSMQEEQQPQEEEDKDKKKKKKKEKKRKKEKEQEDEEAAVEKEKKEKKEKPKKKSKDELVAEQFAKKDIYEKKIEDVVAFENLYFSDFIMGKNNNVKAIGFFSIENKQIYSFEADFKWTGEECRLLDILIELKGSK